MGDANILAVFLLLGLCRNANSLLYAGIRPLLAAIFFLLLLLRFVGCGMFPSLHRLLFVFYDCTKQNELPGNTLVVEGVFFVGWPNTTPSFKSVRQTSDDVIS